MDSNPPPFPHNFCESKKKTMLLWLASSCTPILDSFDSSWRSCCSHHVQESTVHNSSALSTANMVKNIYLSPYIHSPFSLAKTNTSPPRHLIFNSRFKISIMTTFTLGFLLLPSLCVECYLQVLKFYLSLESFIQLIFCSTWAMTLKHLT